MSQMTSFVNAEKAAENVRVLVAMADETARKAHAPTGSGSRTRPAGEGIAGAEAEAEPKERGW
jgi:hypothetical protein